MKRQAIRVEPLSSYAEARKVPIAMAMRAGDLRMVPMRVDADGLI